MLETLLIHEIVDITLEDGIIRTRLKIPFVDLEIARRCVNLRFEAIVDRPYLMLSDARSMKKITKEAREYLSGKEARDGVTAVAVLVEKPVGRIILNFFLAINKPLVPTKSFSKEDDAKKWLRQQG